MNTEYKIITDISYLRQPCEPVGLEEGMRLGKLLIDQLDILKNGIGLSANQIGIRKRVCVVNVKQPIILINPEVVGAFEKILFNEGCLSFEGDVIQTHRYRNVLIKSDTQDGILSFYGMSDVDLLESVCAQHEIDHLNGITMHDRKA